MAIDGEIDVGLVGVLIERVEGLSYHLAIAEGSDDVVVGRIKRGTFLGVERHLSADRHRLVEPALVNFVPRTFVGHLYLQEQRFRQPLVIGQVDDMMVQADGEFGLHSEGERFLFLGFERTLRRRNGHPLRQILHRILARHTGVVDDARAELITILGIRDINMLRALVPYDAIEVDIDAPHNRRRESVAVEVFDIADGEIHRSLVDFTRLGFDVDEQVGQLVIPRKGQFGQLSSVANRRAVVLVRLRREVVHEQRLLFVHGVAVGILEHATVVRRINELHHAARVTLDLREGEEVNQAHLISVRGLGAELANKLVGQRLLEEAYIVDMSVQSLGEPYVRSR